MRKPAKPSSRAGVKRRKDKNMTFKEFKKTFKGGYVKLADENIRGFCRKGYQLYGNCDDMIVTDYYERETDEIYTVYLREAKKMR